MTDKKILILIFVVAFLTLLIGCLPGLTPPPPKGIISGRIMVPGSETTKDIIGWIPVANATVTLTDSEGITRTVTTDENGYYAFTDIAVNANTIITATATINGNTVIIKDVIPQAVAADEDYNAKTADAESTALALIVEELLEQGLDPEYINLEEIQDSDNFTEVVGQVTSVLEENGNVTIDPGVTNIVDYVAGDIINPPAYTPPEELPEPEPEPEPGPETVILTYIVVLPVEMTLFVGEFEVITPVTAHYSDGSSANIVLGNCTYTSSAVGIAKVSDAGVVTAVTAGTATITVSYAGKTDTLEITVNPILLTSIIVLPETMTLFVGDSKDVESITAHYNNGSIADIAIEECTYLSSDTEVATVTTTGLVSALTFGTAIVTVSYGGEIDDLVVTVIGPVQNITTGGYYDTIQGAINTASDGDTIKVMAGTYNEAVLIDKQLTLLGAQYDIDPTVEGARIDESAESVIDAGGSSAVVTITADSVSVNGFTITNGGGGAPSHERGGVYLSGILVSGCTISNNKIVENLRDGIDSCSSGSGVNIFENNVISDNGYGAVYLGRNEGGDIFRNNVISYNADGGGTGQIGIQSSDNIVEGNTINGDTYCGIMIMGSHVDIRKNNILRGNIINRGESGPGFSSYGIGIAYAENTLVEDNIIHNNFGGLGVFQYVDTTSLIGNDIQGNDEYGIKVGSDYGDTKDTTIEENDVLSNGVGIWIRATDIAASTTHINRNNIVDNTDYGVKNEISTPVDATDNWWGKASGPIHSGNLGGTGDEVSDNVDYSSFSTEENW